MIHDEIDGLLRLCGGVSHVRRRYIGFATIFFLFPNGHDGELIMGLMAFGE
jgi:hypothetical protein